MILGSLRGGPLRYLDRSRQRRPIAKMRFRAMRRFVFVRSCSNRVRVRLLDLLRELGDDFGLALWSHTERPKSLSHKLSPITHGQTPSTGSRHPRTRATSASVPPTPCGQPPSGGSTA